MIKERIVDGFQNAPHRSLYHALGLTAEEQSRPLIGIGSIMFDGLTAYTVNNLDSVSPFLNLILHALFLISLDTVIFVLFLYMLRVTGSFPIKKWTKALLFVPYALSVVVVIANIGSLEYVVGEISNYSMGVSAYTCYIMAALYIILTIVIFFKHWSYIDEQKRMSILTYLVILASVTGVQMFFPEILITSAAITVLILGIYMNLEDPSLRELSHYHNEMVMGFANLIENRDNNTGGHIKRTVEYVRLITDELKERGLYSEILTKDYVENLLKAAPMHDIGKVSVPDAILCKPGKLTDDEYAAMKKHAERGGDIVRETFRNFGKEDYRQMAFEVARFHHEKWNGKGYPDGISGEDIPLCARIMAVADVFDAISENRCYRPAMPMDKCFAIMEDGKGKDFDPIIAGVFIEIREKVEKVHHELNDMKE